MPNENLHCSRYSYTVHPTETPDASPFFTFSRQGCSTILVKGFVCIDDDNNEVHIGVSDLDYSDTESLADFFKHIHKHYSDLYTTTPEVDIIFLDETEERYNVYRELYANGLISDAFTDDLISIISGNEIL